jgi:hypothetical protein
MTAVFNDAGKTSIADGTSLTGSNGTGGGNTDVVITGTGLVKRINPALAQPASDTAWYEVPAVASGTQSSVTLTAGSFVAATGGACGAWFIINAAPSGVHQLLRFGNSGTAYIGLTAAGKLYMDLNSSLVWTSALAVPFGVPIWISHSSDSKASAGNSKAGYYNAKGVLIESTSQAGVTSAIANATCLFGKGSTGITTSIMEIASLRVNTDANALILPPVPVGVRGWGVAA